MYVGIFQFYCTWKFENFRISPVKQAICLQNSEVLLLRDGSQFPNLSGFSRSFPILKWKPLLTSSLYIVPTAYQVCDAQVRALNVLILNPLLPEILLNLLQNSQDVHASLRPYKDTKYQLMQGRSWSQSPGWARVPLSLNFNHFLQFFLKFSSYLSSFHSYVLNLGPSTYGYLWTWVGYAICGRVPRHPYY